MRKDGLEKTTCISLAGNIAYAFCSCAVGFFVHSWWFITLGAYYCVLSVARFSVLQVRRMSNGDVEFEMFAKKITGVLLVVLSVCLTGVITLSTVEERGIDFHEIVMIAIAAYAFTKITLAIVGLARAKRFASPAVKTLRNISFADALVSVYSLQRSMLVSFPGMPEGESRLMNILTGTAVWLLVFLLGIDLIGGRCVNMTKSKLAEANGKIAEAVVGGYKKIEQGAVDGYKKIESGVVEGYTKLEDKFVGAYLTQDGETVDEAKTRLKGKE